MSAGGADWRTFAAEAPELSAVATSLMERYEVIVLGTTARSGHPRLSLVQPSIVGGDLVISTLDGDAKTTDLRRDPRCGFHCLVHHVDHDEGEVKAAVLAVELHGEALSEAIDATARPEIRWLPTAAFALRVVRASLARRHQPRLVWRNEPGRPPP